MVEFERADRDKMIGSKIRIIRIERAVLPAEHPALSSTVPRLGGLCKLVSSVILELVTLS